MGTGLFQWGGSFLKHFEIPLLQKPPFAWKRDDCPVCTWGACAGQQTRLKFTAPLVPGVHALGPDSSVGGASLRQEQSPDQKQQSPLWGAEGNSNSLFSKNGLAEKSRSPALDYENSGAVRLGLLATRTDRCLCPPPVTAPAAGNAVKRNRHP